MASLIGENCALRRIRLLELMQRQSLDACLVSDVREIYYFTGVLLPSNLPALWMISNEGNCSAIIPAGHTLDTCEDLAVYEWNEQGTRHPHPLRCLLEIVRPHWKSLKLNRLGCQEESLPYRVRAELNAQSGCTFLKVDNQIAEMQQVKDPDEIDVIRESVRADLGAYAAVRDAIRPGLTELEVLAAGIRGAMTTAGEKVFHDGDYQSGTYNGPARNRPLQMGELYIIDAWTCYRGYWSDLSRTYVVGSSPTDVQQGLFDHIRWIQSELTHILKPGIDGTEVFAALDEMIRQHPPLADEGLIHHGGHAIGLRAHELPDINHQRGGTLQAGQVICVEPGGYFPAAQFGVRLENMYLITDRGCEDLCADDPYQMELLRMPPAPSCD